MNASISTTAEKIKAQLLQLAARIEESAFFERMMNRYENADPRMQKRIMVGSYSAALILALAFVMVPLFSIWRAKSRLGDVRGLTAEVKAVNARGNIVYRPAPPPAGWQPIAAESLETFESSLGQYLASMGIPPDLTQVSRSGTGLEVKTSGASLRQLTAVLFLLDGWYPGIKIHQLSSSVSKDSREMVDFSFQIDFDPTEASKLAQGRGGGDPAAAINSFMNAPSPPTSRYEGGGGGGDGAPPPSNDFDYQSTLPPPPPPGGGDGDFDYQEPLEPPPDLPPPPPLEEDL